MKVISSIARVFCMGVMAYIALSAMMFYSGSADIVSLFEGKGDSPFHTIVLIVLCMLVYSDLERKDADRSRLMVLTGLSVCLLAANQWIHM